MGIDSYATTAAGNNTGSALFPEGMLANQVNNSARQMQADVRSWYQEAEWIIWGDTIVWVSGTEFKISGADVTARYSVGRRVRVVGSSTGTIYGRITASAFTTDTTVTVSFDSGSMSNESLAVSIATIKGGSSAQSIDVSGVKNAASTTGDNTFSGNNTFANTGFKILDTDASHALSVVPGSNLTAARTLTLTTGDANRTVTLSGDLTVSSAATVSGTNTGDVAQATQAEMEAASSTSVTVSPGRAQHHPGVGKFYANIDPTSSGSIRSSYNVASIVQNAKGDYTINFSTAFSTVGYAYGGGCGFENFNQNAWVCGPRNVAFSSWKATSSIRLNAVFANGSEVSDTSFIDFTAFGFGDQ
jgi:hypothetical protein